MIVLRFKVQCRPDRVDEARAAFADVVNASRPLEGVVSFDVAQDVTDANSFVATEVFEDQAAMERQEALPEVQTALGLLGEIAAGPPEATIFHVSSSEQPAF
jgi:quinol monooxygenase YgiN